MWTEILVTNDITRAEALKKLLEENAIICRVKTINDEENETKAILVPFQEVNPALELMIDNNLN